MRDERKKDFHYKNTHNSHNPNPRSLKGSASREENSSSVASAGKQEASRNGEVKMVQHNDKWKKKATREYHKKHGTHTAGRGRGRGRGIIEEVPEQQVPADEQLGEESEGESDKDSNDRSDDEEKEVKKERSKYARRKIESNAWRFESEEPDPYLGTSTPTAQLITVIDESALEPPEPDYAHLPARPFEPTKPPRPQGGKKNLSIKESELAPLKAQIDKANAARAFKERFSSGQKGNVVIIEDGVARRQVTRKEEEEDQDDNVDDIDTFLSELDVREGIFLIDRLLMNRCNTFCGI